KKPPVEGKPDGVACRSTSTRCEAVAGLDRGAERQTRAENSTGRRKDHRAKLSENFKSNPTTLAFHDINQDGLNDLIVLVPYEKIKVLLQVPDKPFDEQDVAPPGGSAEQPWLSMADVDGDGKPELLLAQKKYWR